MKYPPEGGIPLPDGENEWGPVLRSAQGGDEGGFEMIYKEINPRLARYCATQCYGSTLDYEELLSETWISVARDISRFSGDFSALRSWIYSIARNRIRDGARRRDRLVRTGWTLDDLHDSELVERAERIEPLIESDEAVAAIVAQIKQLPEAQADVVLLRVVGDISVEECARILGKSENSVRVLSHRGLATLRESLKGEKNEEG